jgi:hypothetical protein
VEVALTERETGKNPKNYFFLVLHLICEELLGFPLNQTTRKERWILKYTL